MPQHSYATFNFLWTYATSLLQAQTPLREDNRIITLDQSLKLRLT